MATTLPISLGGLRGLRDELFPTLAAIERTYDCPIAAYQELDRDVLVIKVGAYTLELARSEIEDNRHLAKLRAFLGPLLEAKMCAKVAGSTGPPPPPDEFYQAMMTAAVKARVLDYNPFLAELKAELKAEVKTTRSAIANNMYRDNTNLYRGEMIMPDPVTAIEPAPAPAKPSWPPAPDLILDETN